jgi:hypothetical protein
MFLINLRISSIFFLARLVRINMEAPLEWSLQLVIVK